MLSGRILGATTPRAGREPLGTADGPILYSRVNAGAWIVDCPYCRSAVGYTNPDVWFLCLDCGNRAGGRLMLPIQWPADMQAIEEALDLRPDYATQNWTTGETVAGLWAENKQMGIR